MKKRTLVLGAMLFCATAGIASPSWLRYAKISPSGEEIAFNYKGDIYKVAIGGGDAIQLTSHQAYDFSPIWSPDGEYVAFGSDRNGNFDIFIMNADGSNLKQLTNTSLREIPTAFSPDGKEIYFSGRIQDPAESALYPSGVMYELYKINVESGKLTRVLGTPADAINFSKDGSTFLYQDRKGSEDKWRKHHVSSVTRDIHTYNLETGKHAEVFTQPGEDLDPIFSNDGKSIYFLSEQGKTMNVYKMKIGDPTSLQQLTHFKHHPVRFLSKADNGTLSFSYDGELYTLNEGGSPKKIDVQITRDLTENDLLKTTYPSGAGWSAVSADGKQIAFIIRGEVFVTHTDYRTTKRITSTAEAEECLSFSPDGRSLIYMSERDDKRQIYMASIERDEEKYFSHATLVKEELIMKDDSKERTLPSFSPDGKEIAFIEDRNNLMVYNIKNKSIRQITDKFTNPSSDGYITYEWSPDGKWIVVNVNDNKHDPYADVAIISADGKEYKNITQSGYMDLGPRWVMNGNAILYMSEKYGMRNHASWGSMWDAMIVFVNKDSYDKFTMSSEDYKLYKESDTTKSKKPKEVNVEFDGIEDRIVRLTPNSSKLGSMNITADGETLYYFSAVEGGYDLWKGSLRKGSYQLLKKLNGGSASLDFSNKGKDLFMLGSTFSKVNPSSGAITPISFAAELEIDRAQEREYMFDRVIRQQKKRFFRTDMHGVDWEFMAKAYRRHLPSINNNYDFSELLSELLGELNVSHTGSGYRPRQTGVSTASFGLFYDFDHAKNGLKVDEILPGSPFDNTSSKLTPGCIIEKINGKSIETNSNYLNYFNGIVGKNTLVTIYNPETRTRWEEVIKPQSFGSENEMLYKRWIDQRRAEVERLSNGRLGYVHIPGMSDDSFREIYSDILGKYNGKEGIVIDTRFNGGGRMHEDIEIFFSGKKYFTQVIRGTESCDMPSRRWNKPSIMLTCEANYSNAHGTPWVYRHRGIGKLVGMPVPGTMTSVSWEKLQDNSMYFGIPIVGYKLPDGSYLENQQLEPDFKVANDPESVVKGEDKQLEKAVEELLKQIDNQQ